MATGKSTARSKGSKTPAKTKTSESNQQTSRNFRSFDNALNSFDTRSTLRVKDKEYQYHSLKALEKAFSKANTDSLPLSRLPFSLKILLENLLRFEDGEAVKKKDIEALIRWNPGAAPNDEIQFMPARVLLQDFTGVPAIADLAAMRDTLKRLGGDPTRINPLQPADIVIDHSVQVDEFGTADSFKINQDKEYERNSERYRFLRWGQGAFDNFRVVPPDTGIVHQVNLEFLAEVAMTSQGWIYPDTLIGTDSHTTMINGLGVLGWGVGGIEAEAAVLGQACSMLIPQVIGFRFVGKLRPGITATDLVLTVTQILRKMNVVGKFVEFFGPGLSHLSLADRATIANMAPEYGATIGIFPIDEVTSSYLELTGRGHLIPRVESYFKEQGLWYSADQPEPSYSEVVELDLASVEASLAGPARPQDRVPLAQVPQSFEKFLKTLTPHTHAKAHKGHDKVHDKVHANGEKPKEPNSASLKNGSVVIAAITSCTNTSNPSVIMAAGLLAKNAVEKGLKTQPWVKTSLAPGSQAVTDYLKEAGLTPYLDALKFNLVGYGCTTCIGNSGPLPDSITHAIDENDLAVVSVLSGNRNFAGRINSHVRANYLASPPLVVAYALAGTAEINMETDPLGTGKDGKPVYLKDIWPSSQQLNDYTKKYVTSAQFKKSYSDVFSGHDAWKNLKVPTGELYEWEPQSTYIKRPPFFDELKAKPTPVKDITNAQVLAYFGDSVTTDHISPAGSFKKSTPAGSYLTSLGVHPHDFNSYGARRGNHEVMVRGTFANIRLKNLLMPGIEGGVTRHFPSGKEMSIYDASMQYQADQVPLIIIAGKEYGTGSSRDWAAKGPKLLGVKAVIAESFERIHRSNLVGMGILPLQFLAGESGPGLKLTGTETFTIQNLALLKPGQTLQVQASGQDASGKPIQQVFQALVRIDTLNELEYFRNGGILPYVLRQILKDKSAEAEQTGSRAKPA